LKQGVFRTKQATCRRSEANHLAVAKGIHTYPEREQPGEPALPVGRQILRPRPATVLAGFGGIYDWL
jgi:hypothetical protein